MVDITTTLTYILEILLGLLGWFIIRLISQQDATIKENSDGVSVLKTSVSRLETMTSKNDTNFEKATSDMQEIRDNYITRFEELERLVRENKDELKGDLATFALQVASSASELKTQMGMVLKKLDI